MASHAQGQTFFSPLSPSFSVAASDRPSRDLFLDGPPSKRALLSFLTNEEKLDTLGGSTQSVPPLFTSCDSLRLVVRKLPRLRRIWGIHPRLFASYYAYVLGQVWREICMRTYAMTALFQNLIPHSRQFVALLLIHRSDRVQKVLLL